jgi:hypothetical protein
MTEPVKETIDLDVTFAELRVSELFVWRDALGWSSRANFTTNRRGVYAKGDSFSGALAALVVKLREGA